jgi:hypothetical protein
MSIYTVLCWWLPLWLPLQEIFKAISTSPLPLLPPYCNRVVVGWRMQRRVKLQHDSTPRIHNGVAGLTDKTTVQLLTGVDTISIFTLQFPPPPTNICIRYKYSRAHSTIEASISFIDRWLFKCRPSYYPEIFLQTCSTETTKNTLDKAFAIL